ncbi:MAG: hypothetical protein K6U74_19415 [Firmicutes bacterium]|nr:hypothetical protein [Bacillota bacterium]
MRVINFCPKCGGKEITLEPELGQYTLNCNICNLYCEIVVIDEGDSEPGED